MKSKIKEAQKLSTNKDKEQINEEKNKSMEEIRSRKLKEWEVIKRDERLDEKRKIGLKIQRWVRQREI